MLSSLKKWVQDVTVDLAPPPPPPPPPPPRPSPSAASFSSSSSIPESTDHYFYSTAPSHEHHGSRYSTSSVVYISKPVSLDSVHGAKGSSFTAAPPLVSPADVDLSHLNREEQEHIANVLRRARAVEEQQPPPPTTTTMSPAASRTPSLASSSSSSSTSTDSFAADKREQDDEDEIAIEIDKSVASAASEHCQTCGKLRRATSPLCAQCQPNGSADARTENDTIRTRQQLTPVEQSPSPLTVTDDDDDDECDSSMTADQEAQDVNLNEENPSISLERSRRSNLTEIDENEFFYDEPSPYVAAIASAKPAETAVPSYQIDECIDEDDADERDHVKELEKTIENLSRHLPSPINRSSPTNQIDTTSILEMEIESPTACEALSQPLPTPPLSVALPGPTSISHRRGSLSRSSGVREHLTDLLVPAAPEPRQHAHRMSTTSHKRMPSITRPKRNLPYPPNFASLNMLQLRRANSESRFTLPAVPHSMLTSSPNLDDEGDLLEIDLSDPSAAIRRVASSQLEPEFRNHTGHTHYRSASNDNFTSRVKQLRDQTTNTPPMASFNASVKSKKKVKKKDSSSSTTTTTSEPTPSPLPAPAAPTVVPPPAPTKKLQKSTSTEITYPFPTTKLILTSSRHGISSDLGFQITGGHSIPHCMEVTACIKNIDYHHRNYEILKNVVQEGDEVLELGGVSLRGKSALFVENLMRNIQNEFEIIVRSQLVSTDPHTSLTTETNIQRRHSMDVYKLVPANHSVTKSKSASIYSLHKKVAATTIPESAEEDQKSSPTRTLPTGEDSPKPFPHRPRSSLLPNDPGLNGAGSNHSIERQNSNESDESDTLSQYFHSPQNRTSSPTPNPISHGRSQSVIPLASESMSTSRHLQNLFKSDNKRAARGSTSMERKSSLAFSSLNFLKKKTKSVDFPTQRNTIVNQLGEHDYVGDIEIRIGHNSEREQLEVGILQAKNVLPKDTNGFSDPFVKVYLLPGRDQENKRRTKHVSKTLNPVWNQTVVYGHMHREELQYKKLEFTVWDYDRFKANDFLGQVIIDLKNPDVIDDRPHWYRLQALRSREEAANRGSSPRLFKMVSVDSAASSTSTLNKHSVQARVNPLK